MHINIGDTKLFFEVYGEKLVLAGADTKEKLKEKNIPVDEGVAITKQFLDGPLTNEVLEKYFFAILTLFGKPVDVIDDFSLVDPKCVNIKL